MLFSNTFIINSSLYNQINKRIEYKKSTSGTQIKQKTLNAFFLPKKAMICFPT